MSTTPLVVRPLQRRPYAEALDAMRAFTGTRGDDTPDELWLTEHPPVFTLGLAGRLEHLHGPGDIPVVRTERGGQVTYNGPGQVVAYLLLDLRRRQLTVRDLVCRIEAGVIACLAGWGVTAVRRPGAPGVYVAGHDGQPGAKIASVGLKVSRGCTYHGVALNVAMELAPFLRIDPCGYPGLEVTDLAHELRAAGAGPVDAATVAPGFALALETALAGTACAPAASVSPAATDSTGVMRATQEAR